MNAGYIPCPFDSGLYPAFFIPVPQRSNKQEYILPFRISFVFLRHNQ